MSSPLIFHPYKVSMSSLFPQIYIIHVQIISTHICIWVFSMYQLPQVFSDDSNDSRGDLNFRITYSQRNNKIMGCRYGNLITISFYTLFAIIAVLSFQLVIYLVSLQWVINPSVRLRSIVGWNLILPYTITKIIPLIG